MALELIGQIPCANCGHDLMDHNWREDKCYIQPCEKRCKKFVFPPSPETGRAELIKTFKRDGLVYVKVIK